jgi:hypothetical protein
VRLPWFVWTSLVSVTCILVGTYWDISWHMSIGRDSFWTPAHLLIQAGGILGGASGAVLILFRRDPASVRVWGFRGPLGAFVSAWGAATMVVSAPFDNWWHGAYGLDVKILSPPHAVLTLGILGVAIGALLVVVATMNRASGETRARLGWVLLAIGGEVLVLAMIAILEKTFRSNLHRADAYQAIAIVAPLFLIAHARVASHRWAATILAGTYTLILVAGVWLCPLVPAQPKLGPVYQPITHLVPLEFPMLLLAPAIAIDLLRGALAHWPRWALAPALGVAFVAILVGVEWPFASWLQSGDAPPRIFGTEYFAYFVQPDWFEPTHQFMPDGALVRGLAIAAALATASSWVGLFVGDAMRRVRR